MVNSIKNIHYLSCTYAILFLIGFVSCNSNQSISKEHISEALDSLALHSDTSTLTREELSSLFQSIPSPLEIAFLIKETGGEYNQHLLNDVRKLNTYTTNQQKAAILGVYGADLAYANIFNKNQDGYNYLDAVSTTAEGLHIGHFFDYTTLKRLLTNNNNLDSLLLISTTNFEQINKHLQKQKNEHLSVLIIVGGWVESMNMLNNVYASVKNEDLKERIGEQKVVLEQLLTLLNHHKNDKLVQSIYTDFLELSNVYNSVKIEFKEGEPSFIIENGVMSVIDNSQSKVIIEDTQITAISTRITAIREKII